DVERGHFYQTTATLSNLVIRGDGIPASDGILPTRYQAVSRTGQAVDLYDGGNYSIVNTMSDQGQSDTVRMNGRFDLGRDFGRLALKVGVAYDRTERDERRFTKQWNFRPNGATDVAARMASRFDVFDPAFNDEGPTVYGQPARWLSGAKMYQLYLQNPSWFVLDEPLAHQSAVNNSRTFKEAVSAAYLRGDIRLLQQRLWLVAGVRFERTETAGAGPLNDINAQYQRNPDGTFVRNSAGQRVFITTDPLAQRKLRFQERAAFAARTYDGLYPSLNTTFDLSDKLILRAAYARTLGRPNLSFIAPGLTISEPDVANPTITVNNTGLTPWTADSFDLALEAYHLKDGMGSVGIFRKQIKDFFGVLNTPATPELLEQYGLGDDPTFANYNLATRVNAGDAEIDGIELGYRQSLTFLPHWARGLQVFVNATKLELRGSNTADFSSFNPETISGGINFVRARYFFRFTYSHLGETRRGLVAVNTANGIPADTYNYQGKRTRYGVNAQYSINPRCALYFSISDLGGFVQDLRRYAPTTPEYARSQRRQELGFYTTIGVRGSF
ncbi:MAG TPA: hypothetical protein PLN52_00460, partial [Opitutaceae bacterium]|nr:hypothetical protein [Opitutaceae bacterium]